MFHHIAKLKQQRSAQNSTNQTTEGSSSVHSKVVSDVISQQPAVEKTDEKIAPRPMVNIFRAAPMVRKTVEASTPAQPVKQEVVLPDPFVKLDVNGTAEVHEPEVEELAQSAQAMAILGQYRKSRLEFGMVRMRMGSYLTLIKDNKLWRGVAENWESFLAAENLNVHAARQYMAVARKYIFDMDLPEETLGKLSMAGIGALEKAGKVINDENQSDMIDVLTSLSEKDAIQRIIEMSGEDESSSDKPTLRVLKMLRDFYDMPPDLQVDFLGKVAGNRKRMEKERSKDLAPKR